MIADRSVTARVGNQETDVANVSLGTMVTDAKVGYSFNKQK